MSNYTIEVTENVVNLDVLKDHDVIIEIKSSDNFITFDTPSGYPILFTSGTLPVSRVGSGYLIENLTSGNTIVRTFGNQLVSGIKTFNDNVIISGYLSTRSEASNIGASHFPVFISDPSTFARNIHTRTPSQLKSDLAINNVQNIALTGVNFAAGSGLVGGGNLSTSRSFDVGQGDGLIVNADSIAVDSTVVRTTGEQTLSGGKTFSGTGIKITTGAIGINRKDILLRGNTGTLFNNTVTITPTTNLYTDRIYYLPEAGADADFVMTAGGQVITGQKTFTAPLIFNSGTFQFLKVGVNDVSVSGHVHTVSNITDFNTSVDSRITNANLQPSGNYSIVGHTHSSSNITDFNSSVSGLLPITLLTAGSGIGISGVGSNYTISTTGTFGLTQSQVDSRVNTLTSGVYAPLNSPSFSGVPLTPTAASGTNNTQIASTAFVRTEISNLVASAPTALDTLNELAIALGNDSNFSTTITNNLAGKAALSGATFTGSISSPSGNFTSLTVSEKPVINGGYDYEIHVSQIDGDDTTGNGDLLNPVASITKALTLVGSQRKTIIVHPGTYTENPSITVQYTTITGPGLIGGNILLSGTLSTNTGCTIAGIKMTNLTITTPNGTGNVNILNCEISGTLTKSSNADYTVLRLCDYGAASITGAGLVAIFGGNPNFTTVNNAGANVIIKSAVTVAPVLTSGTLSLVDSVVVAAVTNAITSAASSVITLANCQMLTSTLSNVAPIVLNGFYSIISCVYNKPSSTLATLSATGGSTNSIDYFQYINADKFITQGGTSSQYVKGDGSLALFPDNIVYTSGNQTISGVKTFSDLPFVNGTGISISGHNHISSNITDFNSSVSGLLPVKDIIAGSGIQVGSTSGTYTITAFGVAASSASSLITRADNMTGATISKMSVVYINGGHGNRPTIQKSIGSAESTSSKTYGITASDINDNQTGDIVVFGALIDVNTNQFGASEGSTLYLSPSISGGITATKPLAPNHLVAVGKIVRNHNTQGIIEVSIQNGFELYELHDVAVTGATSGQFLQYNSSSGLWVPSSSGNFSTLLVNGTGVSISGHTHSSSDITNFNSSVSGLLPVGTTNYLSKFGTGGSGLSNSLVFDNGTSVGINTNTPSSSARLEVNGAIQQTWSSSRFGMFFDNTYRMGINYNASSRIMQLFSTSSDSNGHIAFSTRIGAGSSDTDYGTERMRITNLGYVGIGTTTPSGQLTIGGTIAGGSIGTTGILLNSTHTSTAANNQNHSAISLAPAFSTASSNLGTTYGIYIQPSHSGVYTTSNHYSLYVNNSTLVTGALTNNYCAAFMGGNVGIGTTTPTSKLHVAGDVNIDGNLTFDSFTESVVAIGNSSTSQTISLTSGTVQTCTLTGNCTFTMPTATAGKSFSLFLNTGSGGFTATFTGVRWSDSTPPTITSTASKVDLLSFISDGSFWYGSFSQNYG